MSGTMPSCVGLNIASATAALIAAGIYVPLPTYAFVASTLTVVFAPGKPSGIVTAQSIAASTPTAANTPVTLTANEFPVGVVYP